MSVRLVDAHVHLWDLHRHGLAWFRPSLGLPGTASPSDLRAASGAGALDGPDAVLDVAVAVQAGDGADEVAWLTGQRHPLLGGAVLQYVPQDEPEAQVVGAASTRAVRGFRVAVPDRAADLADVPGLDRLLAAAGDARMVVDFLVRWQQLPAVAAFAARHPRTSVVVCHLGLGQGEPVEGWRRGLVQLAATPNVAGKVSGLVGTGPDDRSRLTEVVHLAVEELGTDRLMFGSDWPISARVAPYPRIVARTAAALPALTPTERQAFWGGTAARLYRV